MCLNSFGLVQGSAVPFRNRSLFNKGKNTKPQYMTTKNIYNKSHIKYVEFPSQFSFFYAFFAGHQQKAGS